MSKNVVVVASAVRHRITNHHGDVLEEWGGSIMSTTSALASVVEPFREVIPLARIGTDDLDEYSAYVRETGGYRVNCGYLLPDERGTNFHDATWVGEGDRVRIKRRGEPVHFEDFSPGLLENAAAVVLSSGEVVNYDYDIPRRIKEQYPGVLVHMDVHRNVNEADEDGWLSSPGWPEWRETFPYCDSVSMNRMEASALLGTVIGTMDEAHAAVQTFLKAGSGQTIITLARDGCVFGADAESPILQLPTIVRGRVRDVTGAGCAFVGGFVAARLRGRDLIGSVLIGTALAAIVCEKLWYLRSGDASYEELERMADDPQP